MSRSKATKRRKVWVVLNDDGDVCVATPHASEARVAAADARADGHSQRAICFIERLPGDVVLSRKDVDTTANDVAREMLARGYTARMADEVGTIVATYLLRGRR